MPKKIKLKYTKERMVLSDILPYEIPITFSNRAFYDLLNEIKLNYSLADKRFYWKSNDPCLDKTVLLLLGLPLTSTIGSKLDKGEETHFSEAVSKGAMATIPYAFQISHKENSFRELAVIHPRNQVVATAFYEKYKEAILHYSSISKFSLRAPDSIAKCIYWDDKSRLQEFTDEESVIEQDGNEYKNLRSFFVYKSFSNIFKFYESPAYHRCEKQYNTMVKLDVSKCFDSIYTHTIAWSILSKESVKQALSSGGGGALDGTFAGQFDALMQNVNYHETNGILIGPELSRVFAELIMQKIDFNVEERLKDKGLAFKKDYEIYRYVDDYFVFYNSEDSYKEIITLLQQSLKEYKLHLNTHKEIKYRKPIITEITIAKKHIADLLTEKIRYNIEEEEVEVEIGGVVEKQLIKKGTIYINSNSLITTFKTILKVSQVEYKDILNYTLSVLERKLKKIIKDYINLGKDIDPSKFEPHRRMFVNAIISILEYSFFIYSVSPRVNTTVKLSRILDQIISLLKLKKMGEDNRHLIYKIIFDNVCFILKKNKSQEYCQVETLYLLIILSQLGKEYWLDQSFLASVCGAKAEAGGYGFKYELNHFSITVLLFYMKNKVRYKGLKEALIKIIKDKYANQDATKLRRSELTILLMDLLACPYLSSSFKCYLLSLYGVDTAQEVARISNQRPYWFTKWVNFNFAKELDSKRSLDVY